MGVHKVDRRAQNPVSLLAFADQHAPAGGSEHAGGAAHATDGFRTRYPVPDGRDGLCAELLRPEPDLFPERALICMSGSDGDFALAKQLTGVFRSRGLASLACFSQPSLPEAIYHVPVDPVEEAALRLRGMARDRVGVWASPGVPSWHCWLRVCSPASSTRWSLPRR